MHKYDIRDIWMALKLSSNNFFSLIILIWLPTIFLYFNPLAIKIDNTTLSNIYIIVLVLTGLIFIQSIIIYLANRKYIIDLEKGTITFPKSDVENSIFAIILLFPYWNLMRTMTITASELENVYIDTKRWSTKHQTYAGTTDKGKSKYRNETKNHVRYTINITGKFGSANLQFLERQKRDEVRNAIQQCIKQHTGKNIDKKVAEFN